MTQPIAAPQERNFGVEGLIIPLDPTRAIVYGTEPAKKLLAVTLDAHFLDPITGARHSRVITPTQNSGFVTVGMIDGTSITTYMIQGQWYPFTAIKILTSGTDAGLGLQWGY